MDHRNKAPFSLFPLGFFIFTTLSRSQYRLQGPVVALSIEPGVPQLPPLQTHQDDNVPPTRQQRGQRVPQSGAQHAPAAPALHPGLAPVADGRAGPLPEPAPPGHPRVRSVAGQHRGLLPGHDPPARGPGDQPGRAERADQGRARHAAVCDQGQAQEWKAWAAMGASAVEQHAGRRGESRSSCVHFPS
jgi:hypothetical protein